MCTTMTARELAKCDSRSRVYKRMYNTFDAIPAACRAALREQGGWDNHQLRKCFGRVCSHGEKSVAYPIDGVRVYAYM